MGFCKFTKSGRPASVSGDRKSLSLRGVPQGHLLRGAKRRGNPFFSCKETDSHASDAVTGVGMTGSGTSGTPSPTGCSSHTGTSGRRPLQRLTAPIRRGRCPHIAPPDKCAFCGGTHGSRPTGYAGHAGRDGGTPSPTTVHRTHPQGDDAHTSPRRQHKEAGASACQLVEKVRMDFFGKLAGKIAK